MPRHDPLNLAVESTPTGRLAWHFVATDRFPAVKRFDGDTVERHVLRAYAPESPLFGPKAHLITMGSCFARYIHERLAERGRGADNVLVPSGLNNSFALKSFLAWVFTGERGDEAYWYDRNPSGGIERWMGDRDRLFDAFDRADGFVLTLGLSEVWRDGATGKVFWRGVPKTIFKQGRHVCRLSTVEENKANIGSILDLFRKHTGKPVVLTLSPVPLKATALAPSIFGADCASKSILRAALAETLPFYEEAYYWPSFEVVRWLGAHRGGPSFGDMDCRHVNRGLINLIVDEFEAAFFEEQT